MDFAADELSISEFLQLKINNPLVVVNPLPENEDEFKKVFGKEVIIVAVSDEDPEQAQKALSAVYQESIVTFAFLIQSKSLRGGAGKLGIYALRSLILEHMLGYEPTQGQPFTYSGFKMQDKVDDVFNYAMYFKTKTFVLQETDNDDTEKVNLQVVTYN